MDAKSYSRFFAKVETDSKGCWRWTSTKNQDGYGRFSLDGKLESAHIVSYRTFVAPVPSGLELDHTCRVPGCVNPHHLEPVTHAENSRRRIYVRENHRNGKKTHCPKSHPLDYVRPDGTGRGCTTCRSFASRNRNRTKVKK